MAGSFLWLRPATPMESLMNDASKRGVLITVYCLTLRSSVPLTDNHIEETLLHLIRKVPSLRVCFRSRGDTLWACDMNTDHLDLQMTESEDLVSEMESLLQYRFPTTEGPLWCARLLPTGAPGRCTRPDLAADFPHTRMLLLANHHGIADGTTNMFVINAFLRLLDDVVTNDTIDDSIQLGRLVGGEETQPLLDERMEQLKKDSVFFEHFVENLKKFKQEKKLIPRAYPMEMNPHFKSQTVLRELDRQATQSFIKRCKQQGVTVNSGFVAAFNVSLVDFVREAGLEQELYHIHGKHSVNLRQYWSGNDCGTLGVHMKTTCKINSTPAKWRDDFWKYARGVHKSMVQVIKNKDPLTYIQAMKRLIHPDKTKDMFAERPLPESDYGLASMGDADHLIPTEGKCTRLSGLHRTTSCFNDPMYVLYHTIRGCFMCSIAYANDFLTRETANTLMDKLFDNLLLVTRM